MAAEYIVGLNYADRLRMIGEARQRAIADHFGAEPMALTSLMGPMSDGPEWPAGAAWQALHHNGFGCVVSDGLSDPWVERERGDIGLGLEVFIESPLSEWQSTQPPTALADSWLFPLLAEVSHTLAGFPRLSQKLLAGELLSLELNIDHLKDGLGRRTVLLNPELAAKLSLPAGDLLLQPVVLLMPEEQRYLRGKGDSGRRELAERLREVGIGRLSLPGRESVL